MSVSHSLASLRGEPPPEAESTEQVCSQTPLSQAHWSGSQRALSPLLPWLSCWNSRKRDISRLRLPSRCSRRCGGHRASPASQIIQEQDMGLVSDAARLHSICQKVVDSHPNESPLKVHAIRNGNKKGSEQADGAGSERDQRTS
ncbi:Glutamyl-tRNA(Gln) amidotransferase subunit B, mitochondrial [Larimichthys crocea]|uniref:Uncharacterized protein n=1 Tax=Larimichthys crocea TaxID=215358 RepID=A0ACD3RV28_LARCR|nr:Glutamyl-tRNA(Gln) amidotransferase subunit B, mitochondrial [Larimichthys crocea]